MHTVLEMISTMEFTRILPSIRPFLPHFAIIREQLLSNLISAIVKIAWPYQEKKGDLSEMFITHLRLPIGQRLRFRLKLLSGCTQCQCEVSKPFVYFLYA